MKKKRQIKVELTFTKDLTDKMIVFVPHDLSSDEWYDVFDVTGLRESLLRRKRKPHDREEV